MGAVLFSPAVKHFRDVELKAGDEAGSLRAVFSTFDIPDRDGDVVRASAFKNGQSVPMVWAHDWSRPVGKGVIRVEKDRAVFDGQFNLATEAGREAYEAVKFAGDLQEYSWGFRITDTQDNTAIRGFDITGAEVFEVSPVLVGANQYTQTLAVKGAACPMCGHVKNADPEPEATQEPEPAEEPDREEDARLAVAAAAVEVANAYFDPA